LSHALTVRAFLWNMRARAAGDMSYVLLIHFNIDWVLFSRIGAPPVLVSEGLPGS
jgi:hypothetical protein